MNKKPVREMLVVVLVILAVVGVVQYIASNAASSAAASAAEAEADRLLPGYTRHAPTGDLTDYAYGGPEAISRVESVLPYTWWGIVYKDCRPWLKAEIVKKTQEAHDLGVSGFSDRKAFWDAAVADLTPRYLRHVSEKFVLSPLAKVVETAKEDGQ